MDGWQINLTGKKGTEEDHFYFAEGKCEGRISGRFRGSNHPHRRTDETAAMNLQGFIETDDSALIMLDYQGFGRSTDRSQELYKLIPASNAATKFRRQVVGFARHTTDSEKYRWLNDAVCAISGEVRAPTGIPREQVKQGRCQTRFQRSGSHLGTTARITWDLQGLTSQYLLGFTDENATK